MIALDKVRLSCESVLASQDLLSYKSRKNIYKFELLNAFKKIEFHRTGWDWIKELRGELIQKIDEIKRRYVKDSLVIVIRIVITLMNLNIQRLGSGNFGVSMSIFIIFHNEPLVSL